MPKLSRYFETRRGDDGVQRMLVSLTGVPLLRIAATNKGTAFTQDERSALGLHGLLPPRVTTIEEQAGRVYAQYVREPVPLAKYQFLRALQERNETLFYAVVERHLAEMLPILYTPTVGDAVKEFHSIYQSARGLSFSVDTIGRAPELCDNCMFDDVRMIVATDSSAILGIGDQGYGGLAIAIGKLALYTAGGGVSPWRSLPVGLDVGTDRKDLHETETYLGARSARLRGESYLDFMDRFVEAIRVRYPRAILQWEDLAKDAAFTVLARYRETLPSFNDDIQGTGAVTLAGVLSACKRKGTKITDERVVVSGAGAGGAGVAWEIVRGMQAAGLSREDALSRVYVMDSKGLLSEGRAMEDYKKPFVRTRASFESWGVVGVPNLAQVVEHAKITCLLGLSGQAGSFTRSIIEGVAKNTPRPIVFALSNPTSSCEALPSDILEWTRGAALVATGSPFDPVHVAGRDVPIGQGNNAFIFPGLGFGAILAEASAITDGMVTEAAQALFEYTEEKHAAAGLIFPPVDELAAVSARVAARVIRRAFADGVGRSERLRGLVDKDQDLLAYVEQKRWHAHYLPCAVA